jgi:hypothetical protein
LFPEERTMFSPTYDLGRIVDCNGAGSDAAALTTSYTPGARISVAGVGNLRLSGTATFGGTATSMVLRLMDYTDAAHPREIATTVPGGATQVEQTIAGAGDFALEANLGGTVDVIAFEKKATTGTALTSADTLTVDAKGSEKF